MVGGIGTAKISNATFTSTSRIIVDVVSGEGAGVGNDIINCGTCRFDGAEIFVRWASNFVPTIGQTFVFLRAERLLVNREPRLTIEDPLPNGFMLKVGVMSDRIFLEAFMPENARKMPSTPKGKHIPVSKISKIENLESTAKKTDTDKSTADDKAA